MFFIEGTLKKKKKEHILPNHQLMIWENQKILIGMFANFIKEIPELMFKNSLIIHSLRINNNNPHQTKN